jgi:hypothetical protein
VKKPLSLIALPLGVIGGLNMITIVMAGGFGAGALCGFLRLRVFVVIVLSPLFAVCAVAGGLIAHTYAGWIVVVVVGAPVALQLAYAAVTLLFHFVDLRKLMPETQMAIGQKLRAQFDASRALSSVLSARAKLLTLSHF